MHTPADPSSGHVVEFCASVVSDGAPVAVVVSPLAGKPLNECFQVVADHVSTHGGKLILGWAIWELPGVFIEAELHAVWKSPLHELVDIAPRAWSFQQITFLPDVHRVYDGRQVDNVRRALVKDNDVKRFLFLQGQRFEILNRGERATQSEVRLTDREAKAFSSLETEAARCEVRFRKRYASNFEAR